MKKNCGEGLLEYSSDSGLPYVPILILPFFSPYNLQIFSLHAQILGLLLLYSILASFLLFGRAVTFLVSFLSYSYLNLLALEPDMRTYLYRESILGLLNVLYVDRTYVVRKHKLSLVILLPKTELTSTEVKLTERNSSRVLQTRASMGKSRITAIMDRFIYEEMVS